MSVLTPETMFTATKMPECSSYQIAKLNMDLVRHLQNYEFGTAEYYEAVADFHDRAADRVRRLANLLGCEQPRAPG